MVYRRQTKQLLNNVKISIPKDTEKPYMQVWQTEDKLKLELLNLEKPFIITLDKRVLPDLVDALIELQNEKLENEN